MSGVLIIKPVSAKLKRDTETFGKMDPFCKVSIEGVSYETKVHSNGGKFPAWKDVLTFNRTNQNLMNIEVWDKDTFNDDMIGECTVPLTTIIEKKKSSDWYTLSYKGKNAGEILIEAEWRPDNTSTQNTHVGHTMPSVMMGGGVGAQPFHPAYGVSYMLPQMYMNQQPQPVYQPVMQPVYAQPTPVYNQPVQQPQYVQPVSYQPQQMMQPTYVQPTYAQPTYMQPQPQSQPQPQPQYVQPQPMMQAYPQQMPQTQGQQVNYAPPGY